MSKPGKVLKALCKRLKVRLTIKRGKKRVYKSVAVLKAQCKRKVKKKKKVKRKRRRKFGASLAVEDDDNNNNNPIDMSLDELERRFNRLGFSVEVQPGDLVNIQSNSNVNKKYIVDIRNKLCECPGCMYSLTCSHLKALFPNDPEVQEPYQSGRAWVKKYKEEHDGREPRDSDRDQRYRTRYKKYWDWHNEMKEIDTTKIENKQGDYKRQRDFGQKRKSRKKVKKEKISASLKKLCKKHKVRLTVKRGKKRVYKSVKVLKAQCNKKKLSKSSSFGKKKKQVKKKKNSIMDTVKKYGIPLGIGGAVLAGGIGTNMYLDNLYTNILLQKIKIDSIKNKALRNHFNQQFITQQFVQEKYKQLIEINNTNNAKEIMTEKEFKLAKDIDKFEKRMYKKDRKLLKKIVKIVPRIRHGEYAVIIAHKFYKDYLKFVMENCTIIGYRDWKEFWNDLRMNIGRNRGRNSIKEYTVNVNRDTSFGSVARMVPVNFRNIQRGSHYIVTKNNGQEISGQIMYYQGPNNHLNYDNNEQDERAFILVKVTEDIGPFFHRIFADQIDRIEKVDFPLLPEALVKKIEGY